MIIIVFYKIKINRNVNLTSTNLITILHIMYYPFKEVEVFSISVK
jgi:hypothetical protein